MKEAKKTAEDLEIDFLFLVLYGTIITIILFVVIGGIALEILLWKANMKGFFYILLSLGVSIIGTVSWLVEKVIEKRKANEEKTISTVEPTTAKS